MKLLIWLLCSVATQASATINFFAKVENESLAEEAILLLHCLSERTGIPWEFRGEKGGSHRLEVEELSGTGKLRGIYLRDGREHSFALSAGESEKACSQLEAPIEPPAVPSAAAPAPNLSPEWGGQVEDSSPGKRTGVWIGLGIAVLATGAFLVWKSRQPAHEGILMR